MNRRQVLALVGALAAARLRAEQAGKLRILILGGTRFIGRHLVETARARGHALTLFNRGKSDPDAFPGIEQLRGDRASDLGALRGRDWDAVIDTSGFVPRQVRDSATLLAGHARQYVFISSISVYAAFQKPNDEDSPLATTSDPATEKVTEENYGALKALCEQAVEAAFPRRTTVVRPGYVVGPEDKSDRFTYWPVRVARGGEMLAPGEPANPVQFVDARDLARFCIDCVERQTHGVFNAVHAPGSVTIGRLLETSRRVAASDASFTWVPAAFLEEQKAIEKIPIWANPAGEWAAESQTSNARAAKAGLRTTPLAETIRDTLAWHRSLPAGQQALKAGLPADEEKRLLALWRERNAR